jgi:hypothetical protein
MYNYNIKAKHMNDMSCFLKSKNFELSIRKASPPPPVKGSANAGVPKSPTKVERIERKMGSGDPFAT